MKKPGWPILAMVAIAVVATALVFHANGKKAILEAQNEKLTTDLSEAQKQNKALSEENEAMKQEKDELAAQLEKYTTPEKTYLKAEAAIADQDYGTATNLLNEVKTKFPCSEFAMKAEGRAVEVAAMVKEQKEAQARVDEAKKAGFKGLKASPTLRLDNLTASVGGANKVKTWRFDNNPSSYFSRDADKDASFYVADVKITSDDKNPILPAFYVGIVNEQGQLSNIQQMEYKFHRWEDYSTYLGLYADTLNNFEKKSTVNFTIGAQLQSKLTNGNTVVMFTTKQQCFERTEQRFREPPIFYEAVGCNVLPATISIDDFAASYTAVKIF